MTAPKQPVILVILDGYGLAPAAPGNAISLAATPVMDALWREYPHTTLSASGEDVGLPAGQMGNSEVGHTNIGAGRVVYQELSRIGRAAENGDFLKNDAIRAAVDHIAATGGSLHLMGLLSDGGVHSHNRHLYALLRAARALGAGRVYVHAFLDGRDCPPESGLGFLEELAPVLEETGAALATVAGRYYAMDRDSRWERVRRAYDALTLPSAPVEARRWVADHYAEGITDEFMPPAACCDGGRIGSGDSVLFFNFRPDRARELTRALTQPGFSGFERAAVPEDLCFVTMTVYDDSFTGLRVAFPPERPSHTLGEVVAAAGIPQLRIAETEKYAHVTFFLNGGREEPFPGEDRILVPSPKVATYDLQPEMSAPEVAAKVCEALRQRRYGLIVLNFANCDMVGHTGSIPAAVQAVETVDRLLGEVVRTARDTGAVALITADHGNADEMLDPAGGPKTSHTTNPVPLIVTAPGAVLREGGRLCDLAPTILGLMGLPSPPEMTGRNLLV